MARYLRRAVLLALLLALTPEAKCAEDDVDDSAAEVGDTAADVGDTDDDVGDTADDVGDTADDVVGDTAGEVGDTAADVGDTDDDVGDTAGDVVGDTDDDDVGDTDDDVGDTDDDDDDTCSTKPSSETGLFGSFISVFPSYISDCEASSGSCMVAMDGDTDTEWEPDPDDLDLTITLRFSKPLPLLMGRVACSNCFCSPQRSVTLTFSDGSMQQAYENYNQTGIENVSEDGWHVFHFINHTTDSLRLTFCPGALSLRELQLFAIPERTVSTHVEPKEPPLSVFFLVEGHGVITLLRFLFDASPGQCLDYAEVKIETATRQQQDSQTLRFRVYEPAAEVGWLCMPGDLLVPGDDISNLTVMGKCSDGSTLSLQRAELFLDTSYAEPLDLGHNIWSQGSPPKVSYYIHFPFTPPLAFHKIRMRLPSTSSSEDTQSIEIAIELKDICLKISLISDGSYWSTLKLPDFEYESIKLIGPDLGTMKHLEAKIYVFQEFDTTKATTTTAIQSTTTAIPDQTTPASPPDVQSKYLAKMRIMQDFQPQLTDSTSSLFLAMEEQFKWMLEDSMSTALGNWFINVSKFSFSEGSIRTSYNIDTHGTNVFNGDRLDTVKSSVTGVFNSSGYEVDPDSFEFYDISGPPPDRSDPKELLLAGILGALVTLAVIGIVIAGILVKHCLKKERSRPEERDRRRSEPDGPPSQQSFSVHNTNPRLIGNHHATHSVNRWVEGNSENTPLPRPASPQSSLMTYQPRGLSGGAGLEGLGQGFSSREAQDIISTFAMDISSEGTVSSRSNDSSGREIDASPQNSYYRDPDAAPRPGQRYSPPELGRDSPPNIGRGRDSPPNIGRGRDSPPNIGRERDSPAPKIGQEIPEDAERYSPPFASVVGPDVRPPMQNPVHNGVPQQNGRINSGFEPDTEQARMHKGSFRRSSKRNSRRKSERDLQRRQLQQQLSQNTEESLDDALSLYYMKDKPKPQESQDTAGASSSPPRPVQDLYHRAPPHWLRANPHGTWEWKSKEQSSHV